MSGIFINYRRADTAEAAKKTYKHLAKKYGADHIFFDVETIDIGQRFTKEIMDKLAQCDFFLLFIGKQWLTLKDDTTKIRLFAEHDLLRKEIEFAIENGLDIIPILADGAVMPQGHDLPPSLVGMPALQHLKFETKTLVSEFNRLIERIEKIRTLRQQKCGELQEVINELTNSADKKVRFIFGKVLVTNYQDYLEGTVLGGSTRPTKAIMLVEQFGCNIISDGSRTPLGWRIFIRWKKETSDQHIKQIVNDIVGITKTWGNHKYEEINLEVERY